MMIQQGVINEEREADKNSPELPGISKKNHILFWNWYSGISKQRFKAKATGDQEEAYKASADIDDHIIRQQVYEENWPAVVQMIR